MSEVGRQGKNDSSLQTLFGKTRLIKFSEQDLILLPTPDFIMIVFYYKLLLV